MIQANEKLLPGNVVMIYDMVTVLDIENIYAISKYDPHSKSFSPIPLTTEVLVEWCGWNRDKNKYWKSWGNNGFHIILWDDYYNAFKLELGLHHYKVLDTLNNLQNLFYFLTGEELVVTIPSPINKKQ
ncbi:MAG: hypothetical protein ABFC84_11980 [Veillonellales bacterium]